MEAVSVKREKLLRLIKELVAIPSITEGPDESRPGLLLAERFSKLAWFREHPECLQLVATPLEGSACALKSLVVRVDAEKSTKQTVLLISHYDVVATECYGELASSAFDTEALGEAFGADSDTLYGRGTMDMKCGAAVEALLLEDFAENRKLFDVNIVAAFVGDEENASAGMRGVLPVLDKMRREGLEFLAAVNTEPGEAGKSGISGPMVFLGTLGKLMPAFYFRGRGAHVGNCYDGSSALLAASQLVCWAEGNPHLADPLHGECPPSWICLDMKSLRTSYSVTVPDRAYAYFNCFTTTNSPALVARQMQAAARWALSRAQEQLTASYRAMLALGYQGSEYRPGPDKVFSLSELRELAEKRCGEGFKKELEQYISELPAGDMRERGIKTVDWIASRAQEEGPYVVCFFLSPWLPVRTDMTEDEKDRKAVAAARAVRKECLEKYGLEMTEVELFAGLCDLSYVGAKVSDEDIEALSENTPGWGTIYSIPLREMQALGLPVINLGASGEAPHRKEERLHLKYSLEILPELLASLIRRLGEK